MLIEDIWPRLAACRFIGPSMFFRSPGDTTAGWERKERAAKAVCGACPVRLPCLETALARREYHQADIVWGGLNDRELRAEARRRRRQREAG